MATNRGNMKQAMKELLGLVGFGPEGEEQQEGAAESVDRAAPVSQPVVERVERVERPAARPAPEAPKAAPEQPRAARPAPEAPKAAPEPPKAARPAPEAPKVQPEPPKAERPRVVEEPVIQREPPVKRSPFSWGSREAAPEPEEPVVKKAPTERGGFFSGFGEPKTTSFSGGQVTKSVPMEDLFFGEEEEEETRPPFIRPGATVVAAGATFFGDIRAEGDVEVLGKVKGNLEATGNVRITGKVLGDVKGEAVVLQGCTVQGNVTSTSSVSLDAGAMVVGDVLALDIEAGGKLKGTLQIARSATFLASAVLAGNVTAGTIVMSQGARIQGAVRIAEDPETNSLFGEGLEI